MKTETLASPHSTVLLLLVLGIARPLCTAECSKGFNSLPTDLQWVKEDLLKLANENQDKWGDPGLQEIMEAKTNQLEEWYVLNRPTNEVTLEQSAWKILWVSNPFYVVDCFGFFDRLGK